MRTMIEVRMRMNETDEEVIHFLMSYNLSELIINLSISCSAFSYIARTTARLH